MFGKLRNQFVVYGILLTWLAGGAVAGVSFVVMNRAIRREANDRVGDAVRAALRLLRDRALLEKTSGDRTEPFDPSDPAHAEHPGVRILVERAKEEGPVFGVVLFEDRGMCIITLDAATDDRPTGRLYPLRGANELTDELRDLLLSPGADYKVPPTVTIFEGPRRIATNVRTKGGSRAVGTLVSVDVEQAVLWRGRVFNGRAFVVSRWMITCYLPIHCPEGKVIGMLYAGLDEEPYVREGQRNLGLFVAVILGLTALFSAFAGWAGHRLSRPLTALTESSREMAEGRYRKVDDLPRRPEEIGVLSTAFNTMVEKVVERTEELARSREEAREALEDYLEVLAFVAHEIKSPVAGGLTTLHLVQKGYVGEVPEKMRPALDALNRYLSRSLDMALSFNALSRVEGAGFELRFSEVEDFAAELVAPSATDLKDEADGRGMTFRIEGTGRAEVDPDLMRVVVDNFLRNAVKYGEEGTEIHVLTESRDGRLHVAVTNRGVGVPEERYGDLFQKFSRLGDAKLKGRKGSGVGLYLSRRIVERHEGRVAVDGEYESHVTFRFEVPEVSQPGPASFV